MFWLWKQLSLLIYGSIFIINRPIKCTLTMETCPACTLVVFFFGGAGIIPWYSRINADIAEDPKKKKLVSGLNIEFRVPATTYCQRFADSVYTRTHTLTHTTCTLTYVCIFRDHKKKLRRDKIQQKLVGSSCSACGPYIKSHYKRWGGGTQGSSPDGRDANLSPLTRLDLSRNSQNAQMS